MSQSVTSDLYSSSYAAAYGGLYVDHPQWHGKNAANLALVRSLIRPATAWLDVCCGQAWHRTQLPPLYRYVGLDGIAAQLCAARAAAPGGESVQCDVRTFDFDPPRRFSLVTSFFPAYAYFESEDEILAWVRKLAKWTRAGGHVYLEVIHPEWLLAFNDTAFARETESRVIPRSDDCTRWDYVDPGGHHVMLSPHPDRFVEVLAPLFGEVDTRGSIAGMVQLVARGKLGE